MLLVEKRTGVFGLPDSKGKKMISKIYDSVHKKIFKKRKGMKRLNKSQAYKEATAMSSLSPSIKRVVRYKKKMKEVK